MSRALGWFPIAVVVVWPAAVVPGFVVVQQYAAAPGRLAEPPDRLPTELGLPTQAGRATIVMLAHPRCPCTRASLSELARLLARVGDGATAVVLFADPSGTDWRGSDLWATAQAIPNVIALPDPDESIATALGAYTSGQVLAYDRDGALVFNGGLTISRGHEGDSPGRAALTRLLTSDPSVDSPRTANVFGCDLRDPESAP